MRVSRRHENIPLDPVTRQMVPYLDGIHNQEDLIKELEKSAATGDLAISQNDKPDDDLALIREKLQKARDTSPSHIGRIQDAYG